MGDALVQYVVEEALIVIPMLLVVGKIVKETPRVQNWVIPYVLLVIGIVTTIGIMGVSVDAAIQGVLVSGAAVFSHELFKQAQAKIKKESDK